MREPYPLQVGSHSLGIMENRERLMRGPGGGERTLRAVLQTGTSSLMLAMQGVTQGSASKPLPLLSNSRSNWRLKSEKLADQGGKESSMGLLRCVYPRSSRLTCIARSQPLPQGGVSPIRLRLRELGDPGGASLTHAASPWRRGGACVRAACVDAGKNTAGGLRKPQEASRCPPASVARSLRPRSAGLGFLWYEATPSRP